MKKLPKGPATPKRTPFAALGAIVLAIAAFIAVRMASPSATTQVPVTLVETDRFETTPSDWSSVWATYRPAVAAAARPGGLVVLPEKIALLDRARTARAQEDIAALAHATEATIVAGLEVRADHAYYNRALVVWPDGGAAWYTKQRLVPGWEARDTPGKTPLIVDAAGARLGVAICKDMHIPSIGREYGDAAGLMADPAWDFGQDGWMGARMTALRGVENGYAIARSARNGFVGAYDRTGRVIAEHATNDGMVVAHANLPANGKTTIYARIGDLFGWACVGGVAVLVGWLWLRRRRA